MMFVCETVDIIVVLWRELRHDILSHFFDGLNYGLSVRRHKNDGLLRKKNTKGVILRIVENGKDWNRLEMTILKSLAIFLFFKIQKRWRSFIKPRIHRSPPPLSIAQRNVTPCGNIVRVFAVGVKARVYVTSGKFPIQTKTSPIQTSCIKEVRHTLILRLPFLE